MPDITRQEMVIENVKLEYYVSGRGRILLLIPAFHSDINRFRSLVEYLSRDYKVILPHLPGVSNGDALSHYKYSIKNYAHFIKLFIEELDLKDYLLAGFCLGGAIIVRLLEQGVRRPKHILIFEGIYDADFIHLRPFYEFIKKAALRLGEKSHLLRGVMDLFLHDERIMNVYFHLAYHGEKGLDEIVKHQIRITEVMSTRAYIEVAFDIFNLHLSKEELSFNIPATLVYNKYDNIIDLGPTIKGMQRIFPNSELINVDLTTHSPAGEIDVALVNRMVAPLRKTLKKLS